ncbi:MAG TPA: hypothetical protein VNB06_11720 [Thermoanaerobaculia bacterium]|nr:hypothetical protein [Thermoanaerobaculia bacterium]
MLRLTLAFAALALISGIAGFSPIPTALAGVAKLSLFVFVVLALVSLAAHLTIEREEEAAAEERPEEQHTLWEGDRFP